MRETSGTGPGLVHGIRRVRLRGRSALSSRLKSAALIVSGLVILGTSFLHGCRSNQTILDPRVATIRSRKVLPDLLEHEAQSWLGTPYRYGGTDRRGVDCSGLVQNVYQTQGVALPRTVKEMYDVGRSVPRNALHHGDLVFFRFRRRGRNPDHVGIYLGKGQFIHANSNHGVRREKLSGGTYARHFYGARRVAS